MIERSFWLNNYEQQKRFFKSFFQSKTFFEEHLPSIYKSLTLNLTWTCFDDGIWKGDIHSVRTQNFSKKLIFLTPW